MLRARRLVSAAASNANAHSNASSLSQRLTRRLHTSPTTVLIRLPSMVSRFHGVRVTGGAMSQQLRWQSAMTVEQSTRLSSHMKELVACRDSGNWRAALKHLDTLDKEGFALDAEMYELAMTACARMGKIEVLPGMLQNMQVDDLLPTSRTVDAVLQAYIAAEEWDLIVDLAKDATLKGVMLSDAALQASFEACGKIRSASAARAIISNIEEAGEMPLDQSHYAMAIRACGMAGRPDVASVLIARMEDKSGLEPDAEAFNQLIRSQIVLDMIPEALQTFAAVNERGLVLPESIYTATIDALVTRGEYWHASQLFNQMLAHDLSPSVFCYGRMMVAYTRMHKHDLAADCWDRILAINEPNPNLRKYAKMLQQLSATNDSRLVGKLFDYLYEKFEPAAISDVTYAATIRAYGRAGQVDTALGLFDAFVDARKQANQPLPRSAGIYLAVFNALSRDSEREPEENTHDAKRIWDLMVASVPVVLAPAYASLAGVLASNGDLSTLQDLLDHAEKSMNKSDFTMTTRAGPPTFGGQDTSEWDDEDANNSMGRSPTWHDELLYNGVISGLSKARQDESPRVMEYLQYMKTRGLAIKDSVVRAATDAFVKHEQWPLTYQLAELVDVRELDNADTSFGDTISKLLEAQAWTPARHWLIKAHHLGVVPPIRGKQEVLRSLQERRSHEWQIAFALAKETLSFKNMVHENVEAVANAVEVCLNAGRTDLAIKLFERAATHPSVVKQYKDIALPLRMYKTVLLACMREHSMTPDFDDVLGVDPERAPAKPIQKAEAICAQMLQTYARKNVLDGDALSLAISIKATLGDDDDVMALFEKMKQHDLTPNSYAYNAAIMAYSRARKTDKVVAIRDELAASQSQVLREPVVARSLLFTFAILPDDKLSHQHIASTREKLPHISSEMVVNAFLNARNVGKAVEYFDASCPDAQMVTLLHRILDGPKSSSPASSTHASNHNADVVHAAALLLKYIAFHGLDRVRPSVIMRVTKRLMQNGNMREAMAILELFHARDSEVKLAEMTPLFQRQVFELLLHIYGVEREFTKLGELFDRAKTSVVPLNLQYYQRAMAMCASIDASEPMMIGAKKATKKQREELAQQGAVASIKLFETLRHQFIKPSGAVYLQALESCHKIGRLEDAGARVLHDAVDQGFQWAISSEFFRLATVAAEEQRAKQETLKTSEGEDAPPRRGRKPKASKTVDVAQLASIVLFAHHHGIPTSWRLATLLLECQGDLPRNARNELKHIATEAEAVYAKASAKQKRADPPASPRVVAASKRKPAKPAASSPASPSSTAPGSRWGELYLQKLAADE